MVDPQEGRISVLKLAGDRYAEHGVFERGASARSSILAGLEVGVDDILRAAEEAGADR